MCSTIFDAKLYVVRVVAGYPTGPSIFRNESDRHVGWIRDALCVSTCSCNGSFWAFVPVTCFSSRTKEPFKAYPTGEAVEYGIMGFGWC